MGEVKAYLRSTPARRIIGAFGRSDFVGQLVRIYRR